MHVKHALRHCFALTLFASTLVSSFKTCGCLALVLKEMMQAHMSQVTWKVLFPQIFELQSAADYYNSDLNPI
jgi:hypothetical protein